jgi:hypothetical protein
MARILSLGWMALGTVFLSGCTTLSSGPLMDNPALIMPSPAALKIDNPVYVPQGPWYYNKVFDKVLDIVDDYFDIYSTSRFGGTIRTFPRIAPGLEQPWKSGNPDLYDRLLATLQTIRNRAEVRIDGAKDGGFFIQVVVYKELEDLAQPIRSTQGAAIFQAMPTIERQYEVIDATVLDGGWIPLCRNTALEQLILQRIKDCM